MTVSSATGPFGETDSVSAVPAFGYRGELHIGAGVHLRARDLLPAVGRFQTIDPLDGTPGTPTVSSVYSYANNNPANLVDPLGLRAGDSAFDIVSQVGELLAETLQYLTYDAYYVEQIHQIHRDNFDNRSRTQRSMCRANGENVPCPENVTNAGSRPQSYGAPPAPGSPGVANPGDPSTYAGGPLIDTRPPGIGGGSGGPDRVGGFFADLFEDPPRTLPLVPESVKDGSCAVAEVVGFGGFLRGADDLREGNPGDAEENIVRSSHYTIVVEALRESGKLIGKVLANKYTIGGATLIDGACATR